MEITEIGILSVPVAIYALFQRPLWLLGLAIWFVPFSATAFLNVTSGGDRSGIPLTMFFGSAWLLHAGFNTIMSRGFVIPRVCLEFFVAALVVLLTASASIAWLAINDPMYIVTAPRLDMVFSYPLQFSIGNVTQFAYLAYWTLFAIAMLEKIKAQEDVLMSMRVYVASAAFVSAWGLFQWLLYLVRVPYPAAIFNNNASATAQGYTATLSGDELARISSVAVEPSIMAQSVLLALGCLVALRLKRDEYLFSKRVDFLFVVLCVAVLVLSTSATAYLGLALMIGGILVVVIRRMRVATFAWLSTSIVLVVGLVSALPQAGSIVDLVESQVVGKAESYSVRERAFTLRLAWEYFANSPVMGYGWGSATAHDLVMNVLANVGLVGLLAVLAMLLVACGKLVYVLYRVDGGSPGTRGLATAILVAIGLGSFVNLLTGFSFVFGHLWIFLALANVVAAIIYRGGTERDATGGFGDAHKFRANTP